MANLEPTIPQLIDHETKKILYRFQVPGSDKYPPHLNLIPPADFVPLWDIFNVMRLADTATLIPQIVPTFITDFLHGKPEDATSIAQIEQIDKEYRREKKDIYVDPNIGDRVDWYTDAVFAQQQFTGANPATITVAPIEWVKQFKDAAAAQSNKRVLSLLTSADPKSLYIQDYSYFRDAINVAPDYLMKSEDGTRYACAAVSLFQLNANGKLHPLAIVIDYKRTMNNSVVIFNKTLQPRSSVLARASDPEATDWPWRYAKTCAQVADWTRHEIAVHLVNAHFVEEVTIVAAHRAFPTDHPIFRLLEPHWFKTLSLNAAARFILVPNVIVDLVGFTSDQTYAFVNDAYARFNWTENYIPNDLPRRGFPINDLTGQKGHNYAYGKNMILLWRVLSTFVSSMLAVHYTSDDQVANDQYIKDWVQEMRSETGGNMKSFPFINTIKDLVDAITMCIHIASPQHTAVNYLQEYYQSFVINRPASLFAPPPKTLAELLRYKEDDVLRALPVNRPREWLLSSHLPHLLSFRVAEDQNLINYAASLWNLYKKKDTPAITAAASKLYEDLKVLKELFKKTSDEMDDKTVAYDVLDPNATAVSILI